MDKTYKIGYKVYFNDRLNRVSFHGRDTFPLYIQITFDRKSIFFKSYYFDLFSKPKYLINIVGQKSMPDLKEIIQKEEKLIEFISDRNHENFSLDLFKKEYTFYCRDLLDMIEGDFLDYMYTFFQDEGLHYLAEIIKGSGPNFMAGDIVKDLRKALTPKLYEKLIENSLYYSTAYLPFFSFSEGSKRMNLRIFTIMEWEQPGIQGKFAEFLSKFYSKADYFKIFSDIKKLIFQKVT